MIDLQDIRNQLDVIDDEILQLFEKRMELCKGVAEYKIQNGKKVLDKQRENSKIQVLRDKATTEFSKCCVEDLFRQIMSMSRKLQYRLLAKEGVKGKLPFVAVDGIEKDQVRVVFQGVEGAYSEKAMKKYFGQEVSSFHVETWRDAMEAIHEGMADFAVLPIENSTAGFVSDIYDLLAEFENYIVGEQTVSIDHALLGLPGSTMEDIQTVYSHPQGLMQAARFLGEHPKWKQIATENTAVSAKKVLEDGELSQAAIASRYAAELYGLQVLKCPVVPNKNYTRFIIVCNQKMYAKDAKKVSICFELPHESGSLYNILSHFIYNSLNMTKIESRPIEEKNWEYRFFVDFDGNLNDDGVKNAIRGIEEEAINLRILGNY